RPDRALRPATRIAFLMIALRLFSFAKGSNGAQWRRKMTRFVEDGRPSRKYALSACATSGRSGSESGLRWSRFFGQQCCLEYKRHDYEKGIIKIKAESGTPDSSPAQI